MWTAEQYGWLAALGHAVYVQGAVPEPVAPNLEPNPAVEVRSSAPAAPRPARERPQPPPAPVETAEALPPPRVPVAKLRLPSALDMALIRAARINPNLPEMAPVMAQWPSAAQLRKDPAAKRALWPALRTLRKASRS